MMPFDRMSQRESYDFSLSILIPVYNDEDVLHALFDRLIKNIEPICAAYEIVFIDDGSQDRSVDVLRAIRKQNRHIKIVQLTRNFGQVAAITAGLDHVSNDVVVIMDSDLQDRPEDIHKLLDAMIKEDVPVAIARWVSREDRFFKIFASRLFHKVSTRMTPIHHPQGLGMFRVIKKQIVEALKTHPEKTASSVSLLYWMGYDYAVVDLKRDGRYAGVSGYNLKKMFRLGFDRIFSYSLWPIQAASILGGILGLLSVILAMILVFQKLVFTDVMLPGWTSLIVVILFLFGVNFLFLGIIGEYLGRIFIEAKGRPKYVIGRIYEKGGN